MKDTNLKSICAVALAATVCVAILAPVIGALFYPPGTVSEAFRSKMFELLTYILGLLSGWILGDSGPSKPQPPKPPTTGG